VAGSDSAARTPAEQVDPNAPVITIYRKQLAWLDGTRSRRPADHAMFDGSCRGELVVTIEQDEYGLKGAPVKCGNTTSYRRLMFDSQ
jgi:hypothetical protein